MRTLPLLATLGACPVCGGELTAQAESLSCKNCPQNFPTWAGLPWLFDKPKEYQADWSQRLRFYVQTMERDIQTLKLEQKIPDLLAATAERLRHIIQAKTEQVREIEHLLKDLQVSEEPSIELNSLAGTPLPEQQSLLGYYANVLRDWGWGELENAAALACVSRVIGEGPLGLMAVLGSGPSRLAYDLHRRYPGTTTLAIDINPFYLLVASRMLAGKTLQFYEFPMAPRDLRSTAVKVRCKAPEAVKEGFHFLLADALKPCLRKASIDTILTPWLIDVVPEDFRLFARRINQLIKPGGRWINFGSLVFHQILQSQCYSREEVEAILEETGFELLAKEEPEIPYLKAPHNCQRREEIVYCFSARKLKELEIYEAPNSQPSWLLNSAEIIPVWPELQQQIFFSHTLAVILAQVNGERSFDDITQLLAPQMGLTAEHVLPLLKRVIGRNYNQRSRSRVF